MGDSVAERTKRASLFRRRVPDGASATLGLVGRRLPKALDAYLRSRGTAMLPPDVVVPEDPPSATTVHVDRGLPRILSLRQKVALGVLFLAAAAGFIVAPLDTAIAINVALLLFFAAANVFKLALVRLSLRNPAAIKVPASRCAELRDSDLPVYTILIPLYHEARLVPQLVEGIARLDYPSERLDVKVLLEEDDTETRAAVRAADLPAHFETLIVPDAGPKGKPRACNVGLSRARGDYLVIYDAEDRPDRDQLLKAVAAFEKAEPSVVCLQAKLNYFNRTQNLLTRWFTAEYSCWFDQQLPGLQALDVAIPLGGTSNHFLTARLRELGGWNAFNVTEDADLGIRVFVRGWKTAVLDSTTFEEANSRTGNWIRQRSRWVKGYAQTYLYQMRHPVQLWRRMGAQGFAALHLFFGASTLCLLINPVYIALTVAWYVTHAHGIQLLFPGWLLYLATFSLFIGNASFVLSVISGCFVRRNYEDV
ncbi:MAG: glycosyltransferase, partial [Chloroflexi bacterium]|nr:glycosyltransferase [Chloroflexota bacterium]